MSTYRLGLYYREIKDEIPCRPISHVYVKNPLGASYPDAKGLVSSRPESTDRRSSRIRSTHSSKNCKQSSAK